MTAFVVALRRWARTWPAARHRRLLVFLLPLPLIVPLALAWSGGFDGLYGQDPFSYYDYATGPLLANLRGLHLPPPFFWPPGYPLLVALASLALGATPLAGQLVSLSAGLLVPVLTALLAYELGAGRGGGGRRSEIGGRRAEVGSQRSGDAGCAIGASRSAGGGWGVPLLGGLLAALTGQLWQSSIVVMADTTALAAATAGVWSLARYGRRPSQGRWLALAAGAIAYAVLTRWGYALVAIVAGVAALWVLGGLPRRLAWRHALAAALVVAMILLPVWLPSLQAAMDAAGGPPTFAGDLKVYSWNPLNALRRQFVTADGVLSYRWPNGLWYGLAPAHRFFFTPLLAVFLPVGAWAVLRRGLAGHRQGITAREQRTAEGANAILAVLLLIGWPLIIFAFHAGAPWQNFRFNLAHLPPLAILVAIGIEGAANWLGRRLPDGARRPAGRGLLVAACWLAGACWLALVLSGMAAMSYGGLTLTREFIARKSADLTTVRWVEAQTGPNASLLTFNLTPTFEHYSRLQTHDLYYQDSADLSALREGGGPVYLLIDIAAVEGQWQQRSPSLNYHWLRDEAGLIELGQQRSYTLFRVRAGGEP